jgi:GT2 family glycosyltransferase
MEGTPAVSVVVPTFNRADRLASLLEALEAQTAAGTFEVIVVDDCSTDRTPALLAEREEGAGLDLRVVRLEQNRGPARAREAGWREARAPVVAFTDDDCRPAEDWLEAGLTAIRRSPGAFVQGATMPEPGQAGRIGPFTRTIDVTALDPVFQTCNIFYPRALLERIDGFDVEAFSHGFEDADLGWRAIAAGASPVFEPEALVYHEVAELGPLGKLRVASRWTDGLAAPIRHPELRRRLFHNRLFWQRSHMLLLLAASALLLRGRWRLLAPLFVLPYVRLLRARGEVEGGGPLLAPYYLLYDLVELTTVVRAAIRFRSPML